MEYKKNMIISIISLIIVMVLVIGVSYSFIFSTGNKESENATADTATISLEYTDCATNNQSDCANIEATLKPGAYVTKTFKVRNTGTAAAKYSIIFSTLQNNFKNNELVYKIEDITNNAVTLLDETPVPSANSELTDVVALSNQTLAYQATKEYKITIKFLNLEVDQSNNLNGSFNLRMGIKSEN